MKALNKRITAAYSGSSEDEMARFRRSVRKRALLQCGPSRCIAEFIRDLAADKASHKDMQLRAGRAATNFRRSNADRFADLYLAPQETNS